jgi:prepilin-type N-terminal cleavage/methylation domain-containing protein
VSRLVLYGCPSVSRSRRGMTLVEMFAAVSIFLLVSLAASYLLITSARASQDGLVTIRSESRVRLALDTIRKEVLVGEFMSVQITENGRAVVFKNPVRGKQAELRLVKTTLVFKEDTATNTATRRFDDISDANFSLKENGTILRCQLTSDAMLSGRRDRPITLVDEVLLRNVPTGGVF